MGNSINTELGQQTKRKFEELIKSAGYTSIYQFAKEHNIDMGNLYTNLDGTWKMSLKRMFKIANALGVHIDEIIEVFYPEEYAENMGLL